MHQFDDSKSGDHLETGPEKPPAVLANIPERQGVTGHNVRYVLFFGLTAVIIAFGFTPRQLFQLNHSSLGSSASSLIQSRAATVSVGGTDERFV